MVHDYPTKDLGGKLHPRLDIDAVLVGRHGQPLPLEVSESLPDVVKLARKAIIIVPSRQSSAGISEPMFAMARKGKDKSMYAVEASRLEVTCPC